MSDSRINLEHQRKRAKQLRRGHGDGRADAAERITRHLPRARGWSVERVLAARFTLSEAQLVVAREAGYASWPALRRALDDSAPVSGSALGEAILDAAIAGDDDAVARWLARSPAAARDSLAVAAALGDRAALELLAAAPELADRRTGARGWTPLLYLCCSRYRRGDPDNAAARVAIAARLIDLAVDLDAVGAAPGLTSANVTMFDEHDWRPVEGAAGCAASAELVRALLAAGARLDVTTVALQQAVIGGDLEVLAVLLAASPPWWQVTWALKACAVLDRAAAARLLAPHAARPLAREPALDEAIRRGRGGELIDALLGPGEPCDPATGIAADGADHAARSAHGDRRADATRRVRPPDLVPVWQTAYRRAVRHDHAAARELLRARGLDDRALTAVDRVIAAALTGDPDELARAIAATGHDPRAMRDDDHAVLAWAVAGGRDRAVPLLLSAGCDPGARDRDGETALHLAVRAGSTAMVDALLTAGAAADPRNFDAQTPLELARSLADPAIRAAMVARLLAAGADPGRMSQFVADSEHPAGGERSARGREEEDALRRAGAVEREAPASLFERAADAVATGDVAALRELLDDEPDLVHARSPRPHRATLLHYCAANGTEDPRQRTPPTAPAIAQLLIERGADVEAVCKLYGGGATTLGLLLTSAFPRAAGLDGELVRVLARGGVRVTPDADGNGPLVTAILHGAPRAAEALVEAGAPVDTLFTAAGLDRIAELDRLLAAGAEIDARFATGATALHAAALMGATRAADHLLARGADPTLRDHRWGSTPAGFARHFGHTELAARLDAAPQGSPHA